MKKSRNRFLPVRRNITVAVALIVSFLTLCAFAVTAATGETDTVPLLQRWVFTTPLPILLLKAFGVIFVAGLVGVSGHCWLVPETDKGASDWE